MSEGQHKKINVNALVQLVARDDTGLATYVWRNCNEQGRWLGEPQQGNAADLAAALPVGQREVCLLLAGTEVIAQRLSFDPAERKHLRKLLPFELEEAVAQELGDFHFALGPIVDNQAVIAYVNAEWLNTQIAELESLGIDVMHCFAQPHCLPRPQQGWVLRLDDQLHVHYDAGLGFTIEPDLGAIALQQLCTSQAPPTEILLIADDQTQAQALQTMLPAALREQVGPDQIIVQLADAWDSLNLAQMPALDLRQGAIARQLPLKKWARDWRNVAILGAVALVAYVAINLGNIYITDAKRDALFTERLAVFHQVAQGNAPDPEKQLKDRLAQYQPKASSGSVMAMYANLAPLIANNKAIQLRAFRYTGQTGDIQLTLDAKSYEDVSKLQENIHNTGLSTRLQNTSQQGDMLQARLVVTRAAP